MGKFLVLPLAIGLALAAPGCQRKKADDRPSAGAAPTAASAKAASKPASGDEGYARDVDRICNAEKKSGADELDEGARSMHVAQWLGANIETAAGRDLLGRLRPLKPQDKVELLEGQALEVGLEDCALARSWSGGPKSI